MGAAPAKVVIGYSVAVVEEKAPFKPPLVAHAWHFSLLSAVSVGITDRAVKLYLLGIISGDFLPCTPRFSVGWYCGRGKGISLDLCGFGYGFGAVFNALVHAFSVGSARRGAFGKDCFSWSATPGHALSLTDTRCKGRSSLR